MTIHIAIATALTLALAALPAFAQDAAAPVASATTVNGQVQVNQGERFVPLQQGQALRTGDRVMTLVDGSATLTFEDGCVLNIRPESVVIVSERCDAGAAALPGNSQAVGSTTTTGAGSSGAFGRALPMIATVAIGSAIMVGQSEENDDETVSP